MAQIILYFNAQGQLTAEAPGVNGHVRRKLDLTPELKLAIMSSAIGFELIAQRDRERAIAKHNADLQRHTETQRQEAEIQRLRKSTEPEPALKPTPELPPEHRAEMLATCSLNHPRQVNRCSQIACQAKPGVNGNSAPVPSTPDQCQIPNPSPLLT